MFYREIMAVHFNSFMEYIKVLCQRNAELWVINRVMHILPAGQRVTLHFMYRSVGQVAQSV